MATSHNLPLCYKCGLLILDTCYSSEKTVAGNDAIVEYRHLNACPVKLTIKDVKVYIENTYPGINCKRRNGEYRIVYVKPIVADQEATAYYTTSASDAIGTACQMYKWKIDNQKDGLGRPLQPTLGKPATNPAVCPDCGYPMSVQSPGTCQDCDYRTPELKQAEFIKLIARMKIDGEVVDGEPYQQSIVDALEALDNLIVSARTIMSGGGK